MNSLYELPRQFIMGLANDGFIHFTFSYAFVVNGFLCALVIGPLLGGIGTMVVAKRMAFFSQAVGNAALTGVAIGVIIGESYTAHKFVDEMRENLATLAAAINEAGKSG